MDLQRKLAILADAAKYDASCASSGSDKRDSSRGKGIGSTEGMGICHSFAPDGRCISLLKVLLTNFCIYDCLYCVNRVSSNVPRARFTVEEVVRLTLDFYRRNYIEGLFLSSGIVRSPDHTMEQLVEVARQLREVHDFRGYIHLKTIPDASEGLLARAGRYADRLSINVELPTELGLQQLAPEKDGRAIRTSMARLRGHIDEAREAAREQSRPVAIVRRPGQGGAAAAAGVVGPAAAQPASSMGASAGAAGGSAGGGAPAATAGSTGAPAMPARAARARAPRFAPGGQSTQMIVGADGADDRTILHTSARLYGSYQLRRVYYSAFSPIPDASKGLPLKPPPLLREHRLYQADWLMRFYGFNAEEIVPGACTASAPAARLATAAGADAGGAAGAPPSPGMLALDIDPKLAWALAHRERFPVDLNRAPREMLLRVPGLGVKTVDTLIQARRARRLRCADLQRLRVSLRKVLPFVELADHHPRRALDAADLAASLRPQPVQADLFADAAGAWPAAAAPVSAQAAPRAAAAAAVLADEWRDELAVPLPQPGLCTATDWSALADVRDGAVPQPASPGHPGRPAAEQAPAVPNAALPPDRRPAARLSDAPGMPLAG